ncbi:hypothetical protein [Nonomuraea guangzhouensis]|uniref:Tyr recombinase domain-containing protein n=1 Tax=Nonomuraea guangzhouensis TaxID=1291555 RepID=A0ABW4GXL6_9ACTN|nr:hypothetical protein [Nonomuraea guangzhouensis]
MTDPVAAWRDWLEVLDQAGQVGGRLLRRVNRHGTVGPSLGADAVNVVVRDLAVRTRVPYAETVTAHSLRAGGATVAYAAGVPVAVIAKHGRWAPASPVVLRYIRAVDCWRDNAMRNVGLQRTPGRSGPAGKGADQRGGDNAKAPPVGEARTYPPKQVGESKCTIRPSAPEGAPSPKVGSWAWDWRTAVGGTRE